MAYRSTSRGLGLAVLPAGYSIAGSCDASGNPSGYQTGFYLFNTPTGQQCLSDADISKFATVNITETPKGPVQSSPSPSPNPLPLVNPPASNPPASTSSSLIDSSLVWIKANPLYAAGIAVGAFILLRGLK